MFRRFLIALTAATTFWSTTAVVGPIVFASSTETITKKLDQKTCTGLINLVKQAPPEQLPSQLVTAAQRGDPERLHPQAQAQQA